VTERPRVFLMLAPVLAVIVFLFLGGLAFGLLQSFNYLPFIEKYDFNFDAYNSIFNSRSFRSSLLLTLWIALASTLISSVLAIVCALALRRLQRARQFMTFLFQLNLPIPHTVGAIMVLLLFSQSGYISRLTHAVGLTGGPADFPALVQDPWAIGVIIEYVWKETPFIGINVLAALSGLGMGHEEVAQTLGANRWQRLRHVILPSIMPSMLASSIIVFAFSFGAFEIPYLLAATAPTTLSVLAFRSYSDVDLNARSDAMAMSVIVAVFITVLVFVYARLTRRFVRS
jgi:putative spermidine/putrescine transport system permease protein